MNILLEEQKLYSAVYSFPCYLTLSLYLKEFIINVGNKETSIEIENIENIKIKKHLHQAILHSYQLPCNSILKGTYNYIGLPNHFSSLIKELKTTSELLSFFLLMSSQNVNNFAINFEDIFLEKQQLSIKERNKLLYEISNSQDGAVLYSVDDISIFFSTSKIIEINNSLELSAKYQNLKTNCDNLYSKICILNDSNQYQILNEKMIELKNQSIIV